MAYTNTTAEVRPDLSAAVEEAMGADSKFIQEIVLPVKFTARVTGEYHKITKKASGLLAANLGNSTLRAPKAPYREVNRTYEKDSFKCLDRGLQEVVDDRSSREVAPSFDMELLAAKLTARNLRMAQEKRTAELFQDAANIGTAAAAVAYTEANVATIDFPKDFQAAMQRVNKRGESTNACIIPINVWNLLSRTTLLRKFLFGENGGGVMITPEILQDKFKVRFIIPEASYSTAKEGKDVGDSDLGYLWADTHLWIGQLITDVGEGTLQDGEIATFGGGFAANFVWEQDASGLFVTETFRDEHRRSDIVRVRQDNVEKVINYGAATLITTSFA